MLGELFLQVFFFGESRHMVVPCGVFLTTFKLLSFALPAFLDEEHSPAGAALPREPAKTRKDKPLPETLALFA